MLSLAALDRVYSLTGTFNFRDFGGYAGLDGRMVRAGTLFRSAHLASLTTSDLAVLERLKINLVVDLRHAPERTRQPSRFPTPPPDIIAYPDQDEHMGETLAPHEAFMKYELSCPEDAHNYMMRSYRARPLDAGFQALCKDVLNYMATSDVRNPKNILVHCAAGKDRTGTVCALLQGLLGVSQDDIFEDYMLTMAAINIESVIAPASKVYAKRFGRAFDVEALWPMFSVSPDFLKAALEVIGDIETYVTTILGISDVNVQRIREAYLIAP